MVLDSLSYRVNPTTSRVSSSLNLLALSKLQKHETNMVLESPSYSAIIPTFSGGG